MAARRIEILGVPVDVIDWPSTLLIVEELLERATQPATIVAVNPEKVMFAREDAALLARLRAATLLIPDGIGVVWAARLLGLGRMERVPGSELMPAICDLAARKHCSIFLFGATAAVNSRAGQVLVARYPGLRIAGQRDGFVTQQEMDSLVQQINDSGAQILFIALGSPRQEMWMERYLSKLTIKLCQGVGGTFDVLAGNVKRAPHIFRVLNLEWFYRLLTNPTRIRRQLVLPQFAWKVIRAKLRDATDVSSSM